MHTLDPTVLTIIKTATNFDVFDAFKFEYKRQGILQKINQWLSSIGVLCVPTCPLNPTFDEVEAEPILVNSKQGTWTNFINLVDMAALAIPCGFRSDGLPDGITLIGKKFTDYALLKLAHRYFGRSFSSGSRSFGIFKDKQVSKYDNVTGPEINPNSSIKLAVIGTHLQGLPLHWQLEKVNAAYIAKAKTSKSYRLHALPKDGPISKPGLSRVNSTEGSNINVEIYSIPIENFGEFISMVPQPLGIGSIELESGEWVKPFICEEYSYTVKGSIDITNFGGFRVYYDFIMREKGKTI